jgi:tight adherence protein B
MDVTTIGIGVLAAVGVLFIFMGLAGGQNVSVRLEHYVAAQPQDLGSEGQTSLGQKISGSGALLNLNRLVEARDWGADLARELARADLALKPSEFVAIRVGAMFGIPLFLVLLSPFVEALGNPLLWVIGFVLGFWLPRFWLNRRKSKRLKAFNSNLADTIVLVANALRAGSSFLQAIEMVVRETQPPMSTEFARVIREVNLGLPLDEALANMSRRVRSDDLELMTTAIAIHHTVGGNLAEILDSIAFTIRERVRIKGEIRTLTAQQRMSGYVVGFLPIGLVGILTLIAPGFMDPMLRKPPELFGLPAGVIILAIGAFMMLMGFVFVRRIVDIEV